VREALEKSLTREIAESRESRQSQTKETPPKKELRGIGGWLLFFCLSLTILLPILHVYGLSLRDFSKGIGTEFWANVVAPAPVTLYGIVMGIMLWARRRNFLVHARIFLFLSMGLALAHGVGDLATGARWLTVAAGSIVNILYQGLWLLYFAKSRRVANTFSAEPNGG